MTELRKRDRGEPCACSDIDDSRGWCEPESIDVREHPLEPFVVDTAGAISASS